MMTNKKNEVFIVNMESENRGKINSDGATIEKSIVMTDEEKVVNKARNAFNSDLTKDIKWRKQQLKKLLEMCTENKQQMTEALHKDLRRCPMESSVIELDLLIKDIKETLNHIDDWVKPKKPETSYIYLMAEVIIFNDPLGVVLIIGAWNYPFILLLQPLAGAIAAGNAVVIKPSEFSEACTKFLVETIPKYLDNDAIHVVEGGPKETSSLLEHKFDYIFYTGSSTIGKIIYTAAAKHLTPVTLELGGKNPIFVDDVGDNLAVSAKRILWGKFMNMGQTCIAGDYIICTKDVQNKFIDEVRVILEEWYGTEPEKSPDYCRIVNNRQFSRLQTLLDIDKDKIAIGGICNPADRYISPTIMANVKVTDNIMKDEIFGPILAIVTVEDVSEAIEIINAREKPLALYVFTNKKHIKEMFINETSSGGMAINDTVIHCITDGLPFGGVGNSGTGAYHGKATFDTFSHKKSCLSKNFSVIEETLSAPHYPPYTEKHKKYMNFVLMSSLLKIPRKSITYLLTFALGVGVSFALCACIR